MPLSVKKDVNLSFDNTEIAFAGKSDTDLNRAYWLFKLIGNNSLVKLSKPFANLAIDFHVPVGFVVKPTIFKQFCGGEDIRECEKAIRYLDHYGVGTILDYSVEGKGTEKSFDHTCDEILADIEKSAGDARIPFAVFKVTGIAPFAVLEKVSANTPLSDNEETLWQNVKSRVATICKAAADAGTPILFDAEESWIQHAVDGLCYAEMEKHNRQKPIVYNTIQLYLHKRYSDMVTAHKTAKEKGYLPGFKLVRGAYMEKERDRAEKMGYSSPVQPNKAATDADYNKALDFCINHIETLGLVAGTHNEESSMHLVNHMAKKGVPNNHPHVYFSQLLGMSDHISFNLSNAGYNVAKYVPYGPVREVIPYLLRRAEENTSAAGQTPRELALIMKERKRRKSL